MFSICQIGTDVKGFFCTIESKIISRKLLKSVLQKYKKTDITYVTKKCVPLLGNEVKYERFLGRNRRKKIK